MNNKLLFRKLKRAFSGQRRESGEGSGKRFIFKRTEIKREKAVRAVKSKGNSWNSRAFFLSITILAVIVYSVVQLAIGVHLDDKSKQLQKLREEEAFLVEENKNLDGKVAKHKSKIRVEIAATDELKMQRSTEKNIVRVSGSTVSASLLD